VQPQRRSAPTTLAFHASRIVIDLGVLLAMASMSLDFVSTPSGGKSALAGDALPAVVLLLPIFLITLIPDHTRPLPRPLSWGARVLGLAAFPDADVNHLDAGVDAETHGGSIGIGARMLVFGTFVTLVGISIGLARRFMGLPSGGSPTGATTAPLRRSPQAKASKPTGSRPAPPEPATMVTPVPETRPDTPPAAEPAARRPAKSTPETSPFGEPLFDSLEIPAFVESSDDATLIFEAEAASDRRADEDPGEDD